MYRRPLMRIAVESSTTDLQRMAATLCFYESWLGPYHLQTLRLMTEVAVAFWRRGELVQARCLLECATRDLGRCLGRDHKERLQALTALRDVLMAQREFSRAGAVQKELLEYET